MKARTASFAALVGLCAPAWSCGVCIEDKVAATYDHAVVQRAAAKRQVIVVCGVRGGLDPGRIRNAARQVRGLDRGSVRISSEPPALSFALDREQRPGEALAALQHALPAGTQVELVRLIAPSGKVTSR
jgi:hypothetical protein